MKNLKTYKLFEEIGETLSKDQAARIADDIRATAKNADIKRDDVIRHMNAEVGRFTSQDADMVIGELEKHGEKHIGNWKDSVKQIEQWKKDSIERARADSTINGSTMHYDKRIENEKNTAPGDTMYFEYGAPGIGGVTYEVTRVDPNGDIYGKVIENTGRVLEPEETK